MFGLVLGGVQRARVVAARAACASNCRQLALGVHQFAATNPSLPPGCDFPYATSAQDFIVHPGVSWHTNILPFVEQGPLSERSAAAYRADPTGMAAPHGSVWAAVVPVFLCPTEARRQGTNGLGNYWGLTSYQGVAGTRTRLNDGMLHPELRIRMTDVTDGASNTIMIGERPPGPDGASGGWYSAGGYTRCRYSQVLPAGFVAVNTGGDCPASSSFHPGRLDDECSAGHFWSLHPGGANFAFADGSVRFLRYNVDSILPALATRSGGESVVVPE